MNPRTRIEVVEGPGGGMEVAWDEPDGGTPHHGTVLIAHPHPLFGGTMDNKVVQTLARAAVQSGWRALRFNFRGVGRSAGVHDHGDAESADMLALLKTVEADGAWCVAGFSFGAFVAARVIDAQARDGLLPSRVVLIGTAVARFVVPPLPEPVRERALVIHGEADDTVALADLMAWARPQSLPVTVFPGGGHFFHGQLPLLRNLVARHLIEV